MAFRKSYKKSTPTYRKRKVAYRKKRSFRRKVPRLIRDKSLTVRLQYPEQIALTSTVVGYLNSFNLQPSSCLNWSAYSAIFDTFTVKKFTVVIQMPFDNVNYPANTTSPSLTIGAYKKAEFITALDYDSVGLVPSTTDEVRAYANSKTTVGGRSHVRTCYPKVLNTIRRSLLTTSYVPAKLGKLDVATGDIQLSPTVLFAIDPTESVWQLRTDVYVWLTFYGNRRS